MGFAPRLTVGLAAIALLLGGLGSAAAQSGAEDAFNSRLEPQVKRRSADSRTTVKAAPAPTPDKRPVTVTRATPATPATPAVPGVSAATPATPAVPVALGLSKDAPSGAPAAGVIGRGGSRGGAAPAATPEPTTLLLMGAGVAGLYGLRRRR
jgi:PEP-CTERM motif